MATEPYLVLFDVDGTLVDSQRMIVACMETAFRTFNREPPSRTATLSIVGLSLEEAFMRLIGEDLDAPIKQMAAAYKQAFFDLRASADRDEPLFPGAREAIGLLSTRPDVLLGVATGKSKRGLHSVLEHHGLSGAFVTLQSSDDHPSKPDPSMVLEALRETGVAPERAVIIGDTTYDIEMGRAAGIGAIGVSWGYHDVERLAAVGADVILSDYSELEPALARLFKWR